MQPSAPAVIVGAAADAAVVRHRRIYMKTFGYRVNLIAMSILLCLNFTVSSEPNKSEPPISVEQAVVLAKNYVKEHKIDVSKSYIGSAVLNLNPRGDLGHFWLVT